MSMFLAPACLRLAVANHTFGRWEEEFYFPMFSPKFDAAFGVIVEEHEAFSAGLSEMEEYLVSCLPQGAKYGFDKTAQAHEQHAYIGTKLCAIIDKFANELATHVSLFILCIHILPSLHSQLVQEIDYLHPDKVRASGLTADEVKKAADLSLEHHKTLVRTLFLPLPPYVQPTRCTYLSPERPSSRMLFCCVPKV